MEGFSRVSEGYPERIHVALPEGTPGGFPGINLEGIPDGTSGYFQKKTLRGFSEGMPWRHAKENFWINPRTFKGDSGKNTAETLGGIQE